MVIVVACNMVARHIRIPILNNIRNSHTYKRHFATQQRIAVNNVRFPFTRSYWNMGRNTLVRPILPTNCAPVARFSGGVRIVGAAILKLTRIRYLFLAGGAAGGAATYQKIEEFKEKISGITDFMGRIKGHAPNIGHMGELSRRLSKLGESVNLSNIGEYAEGGILKLQDMGGWLSSRFNAPVVANEDLDVIHNAISEHASKTVPHSAGDKQGNGVVKTRESEKITPKRNEEELREQILAEQIEHQEKMERLREENENLRRDLILKNGSTLSQKNIRRSATEMYSQVLDELDRYNRGSNTQDQLPRVVVVGDQSAGKTSVLEMIAQARIFPRGSGEMMTRSPVKVTMSEGTRHVAKFSDSSKEYDLKNEAELKALRREIEARMRRSVTKEQSVSNETISLMVKGPGLHKMVLVDLPGVISTVTTGMAKDTRTKIREMCKTHMENPNAIILCIQDGSLDAERSNVTDLVSSMDPSGKRTIFVMTKVDVAENSKYNPDRIRKILEGKLFPMKALGYFAVVTGKGNSDDSIDDIKKYEEEFFKNSELLKNGVLKSNQMSTNNLSLAVSKCFWKMVKETVHEQEHLFKATGVNLQREWEYKYPNYRKLDREELFAKAKHEILDEVATISEMHEHHWDETFKKSLWQKISDNIINIYLKALSRETPVEFNITSDIELRNFADKTLPNVCLQVGQSALHEEFKRLLSIPGSGDPILNNIKEVVSSEQHAWDRHRAEESLRVFALSTLEDKNVVGEDNKHGFMQKVIKEKLDETEQELSKLKGPGNAVMWLKWRTRTSEETHRRLTINELERLFSGKQIPATLDSDQLTAMKKNLEVQSVSVDDAFIQDTWDKLHKLMLLKKSLTIANNRQGYIGSWTAVAKEQPTCDSMFFWRIDKMLDATSKILRKHLLNYEIQRFEVSMKSMLNKISDDEAKLETTISGERVDLVEKLKSVRHIQELLNEFIEALNKEKA